MKRKLPTNTGEDQNKVKAKKRGLPNPDQKKSGSRTDDSGQEVARKAARERVGRLIAKKMQAKRNRQRVNATARHRNALGRRKPNPTAWVSPDGVYCNTAFAADYLGKSKSRLQSWRCEGVGPKYLKRGHTVYYRIADIKAHLEMGEGLSSHPSD